MSNSERKTLTFISRSSPHSSGKAKACLDMVLSAAVFDQTVNYIFMDDGVFQLLDKQTPATIHARNVSAAFPALALYGVEMVYVDEEALLDRGLHSDSLLADVEIKVCSAQQIQALIRQSETVFNL